jgi:chromosome segregation ATPase
MPQIEEAQFVHWGSMIPDVIPLAAPGITMAVGPNGSGKSCWLDGLKTILGVADLSQRRTPSSYIYNGGPAEIPADQAWLRATFANPVQRGGRHRVFAVAGGGCERAEHVTVICRVQGDRRRYLVLPGRVAWGQGRPIESDLRELAEIPESRWSGPQRYDHLLDRAGVSKALRGVLALPQGETDRLVLETRPGLMRKLLELTGRQATLDEFRLARTKYDEAKSLHEAAMRQLDHKQIGVEQLRSKVRQHHEWEQLRIHLAELDNLLLPAARHYEASEVLRDATRDLRNQEEEAGRLKADGAEEAVAATRMSGELTGLETQHAELTTREESLRARATAAARLAGQASERALSAWKGFDAAWQTARRASLGEAMASTESAEKELAGCLSEKHAIDVEIEELSVDAERISAGGSLAPAAVRIFCDHLRGESIDAVVLGDELAGRSADPAMLAHAQAALGDAVWAVLVPTTSYAAACEEAASARYSWPVASTGEGAPRGVLRFVEGKPEFGALLAHLDATAALGTADVAELLAAAIDATTPDGMRHGNTISRLAPDSGFALHPQAHELTTGRLEAHLAACEAKRAELEANASTLRQKLTAAYRLLDAVHHLQDMRQKFRAACSDLADAQAKSGSASQEHKIMSAEVRTLYGRIEAGRIEIRTLKDSAKATEGRARESEAAVSTFKARRLAAELRLSENMLPSEFSDDDIARLEPSSALEAQRRLFESTVNDRGRFPEDIQDPVILSQYESEEVRLEEVTQMVADRDAKLDANKRVVEEARKRYDDHIHALVRRLRDKFSEICQLAGIEGKIELAPGDIEDEYGIDVLVAHKTGERPVSYRDGIHSGGQGTKIAIMLLLAAMSLGQTADLLIVDEHTAHLDGTNSSQIAGLMGQLSKRVQFILSSPTDIKGSVNSEWCDIQVTFLPRLPGAPYNPSVRLMSRIEASALDSRFESLQQPLILRYEEML